MQNKAENGTVLQLSSPVNRGRYRYGTEEGREGWGDTASASYFEVVIRGGGL